MSARAWQWRRYKLPHHDLIITSSASAPGLYDLVYAPLSRAECVRRMRVFGQRGKRTVPAELEPDQ